MAIYCNLLEINEGKWDLDFTFTKFFTFPNSFREIQVVPVEEVISSLQSNK